jgi:hypothetical protein
MNNATWVLKEVDKWQDMYSIYNQRLRQNWWVWNVVSDIKGGT